MSLPEPRNLSRWVPSHVDAARVDRVVAHATRERGPARLIGVGGVALAAAAAAAWLVLHHPAAPVVAPVGPAVVASSQAIVLPDGARVSPEANAAVRIDVASRENVALTLEHGAADFVVPHLENRRFVVHAGPFDVVDVGTTFTISLESGVVHVVVREGAVEVRRDGSLVRVIAASESWDGSVAAVAPTVDSVAPPPLAATQTAKTTHASTPTRTPKDLMAEADEARISGRPQDAAKALDALRKQFRSDPRAGIAAFELGRLRLDALGDPKGAVEALDDALLLAPSASFREDAEARRVEALDRSHDARCASARDAYAVHYPSGVHAADVAQRCR